MRWLPWWVIWTRSGKEKVSPTLAAAARTIAILGAIVPHRSTHQRIIVHVLSGQARDDITLHEHVPVQEKKQNGLFVDVPGCSPLECIGRDLSSNVPQGFGPPLSRWESLAGPNAGTQDTHERGKF